MAPLVWDKVGDRIYQTGIDRGVLYLPDVAVVWNGLVSIEEKFSQDRKSYYLDGVKYLENQLAGDYSAQLKAFTYPNEFEQILGVDADPQKRGVFIHDQKAGSFNLSYRTRIGDDVSGVNRGYKIHLLYNLIASPDTNAYDSLNAQSSPILFSWGLSGTPEVAVGYRPTSHISLDSTKMAPGLLSDLEYMLYGSGSELPVLPPLQEILTLINFWGISIVDNGDGTWTATGLNKYIKMLDDTTFQISDVNAIYTDVDTYDISSTQF